MRRSQPNPLARRDYPRRAALQRDLDRYYRECLESPSTRTMTGGMAARQAHCAKISWSRVKAAGRFKDYFEGPGYYAHGAAHENPSGHERDVSDSIWDLVVLPTVAILGLVAIGRAIFSKGSS